MNEQVTYAVRAAALFVALLAPLSVVAQVPVDGGQSRRISTCKYVVTFSPGSDRLTHDALRVVNEAARQAQSNGNHLISIDPHWGTGEMPELVTRRFREIEQELNRVRDPDDRIWMVRVFDASPTRPQAFITVCAPPDSAQYLNTPAPADPNQLVAIQVGHVRLAIALRYLGPGYWRDTPLEPMTVGDMMQLSFGWPGLQDATSNVMHRCAEEQTHGVYCDDSILLYLGTRNGRRFEGLAQSPSTQTADYIRVVGEVYGARFFIKKSHMPEPRGGYFEANTNRPTV